METVNAVMKKDAENQSISFSVNGEELNISLTEDNPQAVKEVFNKLIIRLKKGLFKIDLPELEKDMFAQVAEEYIQQLNKDLKAVHGDLTHYKLLAEPDGE